MIKDQAERKAMFSPLLRGLNDLLSKQWPLIWKICHYGLTISIQYATFLSLTERIGFANAVCTTSDKRLHTLKDFRCIYWIVSILWQWYTYDPSKASRDSRCFCLAVTSLVFVYLQNSLCRYLTDFLHIPVLWRPSIWCDMLMATHTAAVSYYAKHVHSLRYHILALNIKV